MRSTLPAQRHAPPRLRAAQGRRTGCGAHAAGAPSSSVSSLAAEREAARLASQHALLCGDLTAVAATFERPIFTWAGLAGDCVLLDALAACGLLRRVPVVFVDTLHLFPETLDFLAEVEKRYGFTALRYTPLGCPTRAEWRARWGSDLFITDMERYDSVAKVEPLQRALGELRADCWINGRRRDQGAERALLALVEPPPAAAAAAAAAGSSPPPPAKVNPLARWTFEDCFASAARTGAPTHPLHAQGYPSLGDVHSTLPVPREKWFLPGGERQGRFAGLKTADGSAKTECGIHSAGAAGGAGGGGGGGGLAGSSSPLVFPPSSSLLRPQ